MNHAKGREASYIIAIASLCLISSRLGDMNEVHMYWHAATVPHKDLDLYSSSNNDVDEPFVCATHDTGGGKTSQPRTVLGAESVLRSLNGVLGMHDERRTR